MPSTPSVTAVAIVIHPYRRNRILPSLGDATILFLGSSSPTGTQSIQAGSDDQEHLGRRIGLSARRDPLPSLARRGVRTEGANVGWR